MEFRLDHRREFACLHPHLQLVLHIPILQIQLPHQGSFILIEPGAAPRQPAPAWHVPDARGVMQPMVTLVNRTTPLLARQPCQVHHLAPTTTALGSVTS